MKNKAEIHWDELYKIIMMLIVLLALVMAVWLFKDKIYILFDKIKEVLRFKI